MKKIAKRQYNVQSGETITVRAQAVGTACVISYDLDGTEGNLSCDDPLSFPIGNGTRVLTLLLTFSGSSGGSYSFDLESDAGGSDTDEADQGPFGVPTTSITYRFQL